MKTWIKRAIRTFAQTAVGYISVNIALIDFSADKSVLKSCITGVCISAVSAGIAAVMNYREEN